VSSPILSVVAGERVPNPARTTPSTNPANTVDVVGTIGVAGPKVFVQAAEAARAAQAEWAALPAPQRGQVHDEFVKRFSAAVASAAMGDPTQPVLFGPLLDEKFAAGFEKTLGWIAAHHTVIGSTGAEAHLPFGGNGKSGNGSRQSGIWVLDQFTRWQSMNRNYSGNLQKAQLDTVTVETDLDFLLV
jgi:acyl-CoA reductase-like NAD-dependent aldehyde dehydrogenase